MSVFCWIVVLLASVAHLGVHAQQCATVGQSCLVAISLQTRRLHVISAPTSCCSGMTCGSDGKCRQVATSRGDPHFTALSGTNFEFQGAPNMHFNLVSEPHSQLNALFHTLGMGDATFIKAIGFVHNSNHTLIIDSGLNDCSAGASSSHSMDVLVDDSPMAAINKQRVHVHGATNVASLLIDPNINITYKSSKDKEQVIVQTQQVLYTIFRNRNACHLDVDFVVLDANLVGARAWSMHGVLGQTASWVAGDSDHGALAGDESVYLEPGLLSTTSATSTYGRVARM